MEELEKPVFLSSDSIPISEESLFEDECKWFCQIGNIRMFIPEMARRCSLTIFRASLSISHDAIAIKFVYLTILLPHRKPLGLLPVMVCKLQSDLWELATESYP